MLFESVKKLQMFLVHKAQPTDWPKGPEDVKLPFPLPTAPKEIGFTKTEVLASPW